MHTACGQFDHTPLPITPPKPVLIVFTPPPPPPSPHRQLPTLPEAILAHTPATTAPWTPLRMAQKIPPLVSLQ